MRVVVDASLIVDWVGPAQNDEQRPGPRMMKELISTGAEFCAPAFMRQEVANALLTGVRRGLWSGTEADYGFSMATRLPVELTDDLGDLERAWDLSRRYDNTPIYDCIYVALAERLKTRLLTMDVQLAKRLPLPFIEVVG